MAPIKRVANRSFRWNLMGHLLPHSHAWARSARDGRGGGLSQAGPTSRVVGSRRQTVGTRVGGVTLVLEDHGAQDEVGPVVRRLVHTLDHLANASPVTLRAPDDQALPRP